jgi:hypothetical protein
MERLRLRRMEVRRHSKMGRTAARRWRERKPFEKELLPCKAYMGGGSLAIA